MSPLAYFLRAALLSFVASGAASAQTPIDAAAFEAYTQGKTLIYGQQGTPFGIERYLPDNRVQWSFLDEQCMDGRWYAKGPEICFVYDDEPNEQCWLFYLDTGGLSASYTGDSDGSRLYETRQSLGPMRCIGPRVGS